MVILAQRWAEIYMKAHPETSIQVTGAVQGGSCRIDQRTTDIANSSRPIKVRKSKIKKPLNTLGVEIPCGKRRDQLGRLALRSGTSPAPNAIRTARPKVCNGQLTMDIDH